MIETLNLPLQVTRTKNYRILAPLISAMDAGMAVIMAVIFHSKNLQPEILQFIIPGFLLASAFFLPGVLRVLMKPADITINPTSVSITAMGYFGTRGETTVSRSLGEFDHLEAIKKPVKNGYIYQLVLRGKAGKDDVTFDAPQPDIVHDFAARLGALLNMKVIDNA